jgi:Ras-related protein Rab-5C
MIPETAPARSLKIILVGEVGVGKTAIARRYCDMGFSLEMVHSVGVSHLCKIIQNEGCSIELKLWDTAGSEEFAPLVPLYIRGSDIAVVTASVLDRRSIDELKRWKDEVLQIERCCVILGAINKMDMVTDGEIRAGLTGQLQEAFPLLYFTSAKTGEEIEEMIRMGVEKALEEEVVQEVGPVVQETKEKKTCC